MMIRWFRRCEQRDPGELDRIATDAEESASAVQRDARATARRVEPTLSALERIKRENAIYASVMHSLRGAR